jgi:hypothetical protein
VFHLLYNPCFKLFFFPRSAKNACFSPFCVPYFDLISTKTGMQWQSLVYLLITKFHKNLFGSAKILHANRLGRHNKTNRKKYFCNFSLLMCLEWEISTVTLLIEWQEGELKCEWVTFTCEGTISRELETTHYTATDLRSGWFKFWRSTHKFFLTAVTWSSKISCYYHNNINMFSKHFIDFIECYTHKNFFFINLSFNDKIYYRKYEILSSTQCLLGCDAM